MHGKATVVVVDDHPCLRLGLRSALARSSDLNVVGEAADGEQALAVVREHRPDVVVLDLMLPLLNGLGVMRSLSPDLPHVRFVVYSLREEAWLVQEVMAAGAADYVFKSSAEGELVRAVEQVALGRAPGGRGAPWLAPPPRGERRAAARLSRREAEVLRLVALGVAVKDAAARLRVGARTLETYKQRAMHKLQLRSRVDLMRFAEHAGWLNEAPDSASD